jgi:hypothetical protein
MHLPLSAAQDRLIKQITESCEGHREVEIRYLSNGHPFFLTKIVWRGERDNECTT